MTRAKGFWKALTQKFSRRRRKFELELDTPNTEPVFPEVQPRKHLITLEWDPKNERDVDGVYTAYRKFRTEKLTVYHADKKNRPTTQMTEFDPKAGRLVVGSQITRWDRIAADT
jgi:hypothetical protein